MKAIMPSAALGSGGLRASGRIRILYLNNAPFIGGAQITMRAIIERLDRDKFEPFLAISETQFRFVEFFAQGRVPIFLVPMYPLNPPSVAGLHGFVKTVGLLRDVIRREGIHVVHTNTQRGGPIGLALKWATGVKFIWTLNDLGLYRRVRIFTPFPDALTCVSRAMYESLRGWPRHHARVIYNGVVVGDPPLDQRARIRTELRRGLGIPDDALVVGNVSRLVPWKGVHVVFDAMRMVMAARPNVWFLQIGEPSPDNQEYAGQLRRLCESLPGQRGRLLGFRADVGNWYLAFDLLAHAPVLEGGHGHSESFGMTVAEAMGYGLPVVAAGVGGLAEVVADMETGVLVPPNRPDLLAGAVGALLDDPPRRARFGEAGRRRQQMLFSQDREVSEFEALYEELVFGKRGPGLALSP